MRPPLHATGVRRGAAQLSFDTETMRLQEIQVAFA
jgi:hypothetical protein